MGVGRRWGGVHVGVKVGRVGRRWGGVHVGVEVGRVGHGSGEEVVWCTCGVRGGAWESEVIM